MSRFASGFGSLVLDDCIEDEIVAIAVDHSAIICLVDRENRKIFQFEDSSSAYC